MQSLDNIKLIVPLVTLKPKRLKKLVDYVARNQVDALFILGTTGGFYNLTENERNKTIDVVVKEARKKYKEIRREILVLVGAIGETLEQTIRYVNQAEERGADIAVIEPMYGIEGIKPLDYIKAVLEGSNIDLMLYDNANLKQINPNARTYDNLDPSCLETFKENPRILGLKYSSGDKNYLKYILNTFSSNDFKIYQGDESEILWALENQAYGAVPSIANIDPSTCVSLLRRKDGIRSRYQDDIIKLRKQVYGKDFSIEDISAGIKRELPKLRI